MSNPLKDFLSNLPPGQVSNPSALVQLLVQEWSCLHGSDAGGMQAYKLSGRVERLLWQPPFLTFTIERHGGTVNGSTRAELQSWKIDISSLTAQIVKTGHRQLTPASPKLDTSILAKKIADDIVNHQESESLKRYPDGRVKVLIGTVIPDDGYKQTIIGRRKRFHNSLESLLSERGWIPVATNTYKLKPSS